MRWLVLVALVAGVVAVPSTADAATSWWTPEERLGADEASIEEVHDVVLTHDGRPLLLYTVASAVRVRLLSNDGRWRAPTDVFTRSGVGTLDASAVVTADATYVVEHTVADQIEVVRLDGDTWTGLPPLEVGATAWQVNAAPTPEGDLAVAWASSGVIGTATFDGTAWSIPSTTPFAGSWVRSGFTVAPGGTRVVAVGGRAGSGAIGDAGEAHVVTFDGGTWSAPRLLSNRMARFGRDSIVATSEGAALLIKEETPSGDAVDAVATFGSGWRTTRLPGPALGRSSIAVGPDGRARVAVTYEFIHPQRGAEIRVFRHLGGANWSTPDPVVSHDAIDRPQPYLAMAIGRDGTTLVASSIFDFFNPTLLVALRGPGRPWQHPSVHGSRSSRVTQVHPLIDDDGLIHLVWKTQEGQWHTTSGFVVPFDDIQPGAFYTWPVLWAADVGLTTGVGGTDEFQPNRSITRAEAITTLWRLAGEQPAPPSGFEDAAPNAFYTRAVNWARHSGLTTGVGGSNRFEPNRTITRAELVTLLWRLDGSDGAPPAGFVDVAPTAFYARSVNWAKHTGITTGVGGSNRFEPNRDVTRAEAFTFVYRLASSTDVSAAGIASPSAIDEPPFGLRLQPAAPLD